jgi:glutathione synthase
MKTLYVMDPLESLNLEGDSTYMMMLEANKRGGTTFWCTPLELFALGGRAFAKIIEVQVLAVEPFFIQKPALDTDLGEMDVIWLRKDPPFNMAYIFSTYMLDLVPSSTLVLNDPRAIRNFNEKMYALHFAEYCPETLVTREISRAKEWAIQYPKVVIKPWDGNGGRGVLVTAHDDPNFGSMLEILTDNQQEHILVQEYLPEIIEGDKRIILIGGEAVGQMLRVPQKGDHRGNIHVGAGVQACELTDREREICAILAPELQKHNLLFVGIDTIGDKMTEINVTSPTGIQEINRLMGVQLEVLLTDQIEQLFNKRS